MAIKWYYTVQNEIPHHGQMTIIEVQETFYMTVYNLKEKVLL
jgi:hypothetical protein